jgi:hypothetical protein
MRRAFPAGCSDTPPLASPAQAPAALAAAASCPSDRQGSDAAVLATLFLVTAFPIHFPCQNACPSLSLVPRQCRHTTKSRYIVLGWPGPGRAGPVRSAQGHSSGSTFRVVNSFRVPSTVSVGTGLGRLARARRNGCPGLEAVAGRLEQVGIASAIEAPAPPRPRSGPVLHHRPSPRGLHSTAALAHTH